MTTEEGFKKAEEINALFQEVSAKTGNNLTPFFKLVLETLIKNLDEEEQDDNKEDGKNLEDFRKKKTGSDKKGCC